jgi:hypothetical protein
LAGRLAGRARLLAGNRLSERFSATFNLHNATLLRIDPAQRRRHSCDIGILATNFNLLICR